MDSRRSSARVRGLQPLTLKKTMLAVTSLTESPAAIRIDLGAIFVSMELSRSKRLITSLSPGGGEKMSKHTVTGGDLPALFEQFAHLQEKAKARTGRDFPIIVIQEAGLEGFWIHRALENEGIESHVVDPASITTSRRARPTRSTLETDNVATQ